MIRKIARWPFDASLEREWTRLQELQQRKLLTGAEARNTSSLMSDGREGRAMELGELLMMSGSAALRLSYAVEFSTPICQGRIRSNFLRYI